MTTAATTEQYLNSMWNAKKYSPDCTLLYWQCTSKQLRMQFKKRSEEMQTLRAGCSKVEPNFFAPPQTPFPGVRDSQNLISWRWSLPLPTNLVWWGSMHAISSYPQTHPQTHIYPQTGPITIHCATASLVCSVLLYYYLWLLFQRLLLKRLLQARPTGLSKTF